MATWIVSVIWLSLPIGQKFDVSGGAFDRGGAEFQPLEAEFFGAEFSNLFDDFFMNGRVSHHAAFADLEAYVKATAEVCGKHDIAFWSNLETFDRDVGWRFPPIEWTKMKFKMLFSCS